MRILHINSYYSAGAFYRRLFDTQAPLLDAMRVYVPVARGYDASGFDFGAYTDVVEVYRKWDAAIFPLKHEKILRDAENRYRGGFDVIHAHSLFSNGFVAMSLAERLGIPFIAAVRATDVNVFFRRMPHLRQMGRRILRAAKKVVFISDVYRESALAPYLSEAERRTVYEKSIVLPNGIDDFFHQNRGAAKTGANAPLRFLFVGQLIPRKNVKTAIEAVRIYRDTLGDATLTVVGKAVSEAEYRRVMSCPFASYHPPVDMDGLLKRYRENDILLVPSRVETFGLVYAEAMSQGMPVLYTRGQGFDGQYPPGVVGYPVAADDPEGIARAAGEIVRDISAISGRAVEMSGRYDWNAIAWDYVKQYGEVMK